MDSNRVDTLIIGAGVAGLSAGFHLHQKGKTDFQMVENSSRYGGLIRGFSWHDIDCDLAPHRLYCEDETILDELLALVDCRRVVRNSAINLNNKTISDPIQIPELIYYFFPKSLSLITDFMAANIKTKSADDNFYDAVKNSYGTALAELFFRPYAEKLFGIDAEQIDKSWAVQKIRVGGLKGIFKRRNKLYFDHFYYPKQGGYGAFADALARPIESNIQLACSISKIHKDIKNDCYQCDLQTPEGPKQLMVKKIISTIPLPGLFRMLGRQIDVSYRKVKLVYVLIKQKKVMPHQWKYFVSKQNFVNRISEFNNFYPDIEHEHTVLCAEITDIENYSEQGLFKLLQTEFQVEESNISDTKIIDVQHAYPIYQKGFQQIIDAAQQQLGEYENLYTLGRQAQFTHLDIDEIYKDAKSLINTEFR